jgi:hypothetical protein
MEDLKRINDTEILIVLKENFKDQVLDPDITWQDRMELYKQIQLINERIEELKQK